MIISTNTNMATLVIEYDVENKMAKELVTFMKKSGLVKIQKERINKIKSNKPNKTTLDAMADTSKESEKVFHSASELMKDLKS